MNFEFHSVPRIVFGRGTLARVPDLLASFFTSPSPAAHPSPVARGGDIRVLVVTNAGEPGSGNVIDDLAAMLAAASISHALIRQRGEPTVDDVSSAVELARRENCRAVVGLGGGSAIDLAKAVAALLTNGGSPTEYMEVVGLGRKLAVPAAPWLAVPTTAGSGAEVTRNAVIAMPARKFKASIRGELLLARAAVIDPLLHVAVRPEVTARAGMDALCQLIESYASVGASPLTDALAAKGVELAAWALPRAFADGKDLDAREAMALAATLGGITLTNAGLGAVHGLAAPLGANFPAPHGTICAALLSPVLAANIRALRARSPDAAALTRYAHVGRLLTSRSDLDDDAACDSLVEAVARLARELKIEPLSRFGLSEADVQPMVELALKSSSMRYNPVPLSQDGLAGALRRAMTP